MKQPWTIEELQDKFKAQFEVLEFEYPEARGLPPMTTKDALWFLNQIIETAYNRTLTTEEIFLHSQLLCNLTMAAKAEALGYKGRVFLITEDEFKERMEVLTNENN